MSHARVCLAPIRFGAGLKGKIIDAIHSGTPCIMSGVASEGLFGNMDPNGMIENNPQEFANNAVEVFNDKAKWEVFTENGVKVINERFNKNHHQNHLLSRIGLIQNDLSAHRLKNFYGNMLRHHQLQSTKYMSKWIEAKNGNN